MEVYGIKEMVNFGVSKQIARSNLSQSLLNGENQFWGE
jgi:hypothetical protein